MMTPPLGPEQGPFLMPPEMGLEPPQEGGFLMGEQSQQMADPMMQQQENSEDATTGPLFFQINIPEEDQKEIVSLCQKFKNGVVQHAQEKKTTMQRCYAYSRSQFFGDDLLPVADFSAEGTEKDKKTNRPEIFIPVIRQQLKMVYSFIKLSLFPNDEDYFRIRAKSSLPISPEHAKRLQIDPPPEYTQMTEELMAQGVPAEAVAQVLPPPPLPSYTEFEDDLTEGLKYLFKEMQLTEKMGEALFDACWAGNMAAMPCVHYPIYWEWKLNPITGQTEATPVEGEPELSLNVWNPLHFYLDPYASRKENAKWAYFSWKKRQDILDGPYYMNKDKVMGSTNVTDSNMQGKSGALSISQFNSLSNQFQDTEQNCKFDEYYFPYLKLANGTEHRNMIFAVADENQLVEARPNMMPQGLPPAVFGTWMNDKGSPYGTGPAEDGQSLQVFINMAMNHVIETLARSSNMWAIGKNTDITQLQGGAGLIFTTDDPTRDVANVSGDTRNAMMVAELVRMMKGEVEMVIGAQNTYEGASQGTEKTATEFRVKQENSIGITREVIEHIGTTFVKPILHRLMLLAAEIKTEPITVRIENGLQGVRYAKIDFSLLKTGQYEIDLVSINSAQSKEAQIGMLMQFVQMLSTNPMALPVLEPILSKIGNLSGIKDSADLLADVKERLGLLAPPQPIPPDGPSAGEGPTGEQGVGAPPQAVA